MINMNRTQLFQIFKSSFKNWLAHGSPISAAALTFFIILPLPSLLIIIVAFFAQFLGQIQAQQQVIQQITSFAGPAVAGLFQDLITSASSPFTSAWTAFVVVAFSLAGAIGAFAVLRDAMDVIWAVKVPKKRKLISVIKEKLGPFVIVSVLGFIVIAWTGIANMISSTVVNLSENATLTKIAITIGGMLLSFIVATVLFAITYKTIPQARVHWRDVGLSAVTTGIAFTVVNYILGSYTQTFTVTTVGGAAGSLLIILLWIYVLNLIVLFGAEVSKAYAVSPGPHQIYHLPPEAEKVVKPLQKAGEKIEEATKGQIEESPEEKEAEAYVGEEPKKTPVPPTETEIGQSGEKSEIKPQVVPYTKEEIDAKAEIDQGSVEVNVKFKGRQKKKRK